MPRKACTPEAKVLLKDISDAYLDSATPQEFWDKFNDRPYGGGLWSRVAQFIGPASLDELRATLEEPD